jgi:hypothetical protein
MSWWEFRMCAEGLAQSRGAMPSKSDPLELSDEKLQSMRIEGF